MNCNGLFQRSVYLFFLVSLCCLQIELNAVDRSKAVNEKKASLSDNNQSKIVLEYVRTFGDLENSDENYMLFRPFDVIRTADGATFILDAGNHRIQKFDKDGIYLLTIGRKGQGPGEIAEAVSMNIFGENEIRICDMGNQRIQRYSLDGVDLGSVRMGTGGKRLTHFRMLSSGEYISRPAPFMYPNDDPKKVPLLSVMNSECVFERGVGTGRIETFDDFMMTVFMSVFIYETDVQDNMYFAYAFKNKIEKYSKDGELLYEVDRPLDIKLNKDPKNAQELVQVTSAVSVDGKGRLWVSTLIEIPDRTPPEEVEKEKKEGKKKEEESKIQYLALEVFSPDGELIEKMDQPATGTIMPLNPLQTPALDNMRIYGDRIFFIDPFQKMCIYEYKIVN